MGMRMAWHGSGALRGRGGCQPLPAEWHLDCLGCLGAGRIKTTEQLKTAQLFHWNGPNKPFGTGHGGKRAHPELFEPYKGRGDACDPWAKAGPEGDEVALAAELKRKKKKKKKAQQPKSKTPRPASRGDR